MSSVRLLVFAELLPPIGWPFAGLLFWQYGRIELRSFKIFVLLFEEIEEVEETDEDEEEELDERSDDDSLPLVLPELFVVLGADVRLMKLFI